MYSENLRLFLESLAPSGIKYLCFCAVRFTTPRVNTRLREWTLRDTPCYVVPDGFGGYQVYRQEAIKDLLASRCRDSAGDCVVFCVERGAGGTIVVKTNKETYSEDPDPDEFGAAFAFNCDSSAACNFLYSEANMDRFGKTRCYGKSAIMQDEYSEDLFSVEIVSELFKAAAGNIAPTEPSGTGRAQADPMDYKGMTLEADGFTKFLSEKLIAPMRELRGGFQSAQVMFDVAEQDGRVVVMYDFADNTRRVCYVPVDTALAAAYAAENPETADEHEQECAGKVAAALAATAAPTKPKEPTAAPPS